LPAYAEGYVRFCNSFVTEPILPTYEGFVDFILVAFPVGKALPIVRGADNTFSRKDSILSKIEGFLASGTSGKKSSDKSGNFPLLSCHFGPKFLKVASHFSRLKMESDQTSHSFLTSFSLGSKLYSSQKYINKIVTAANENGVIDHMMRYTLRFIKQALDEDFDGDVFSDDLAVATFNHSEIAHKLLKSFAYFK
jgi:hypothetical protein